MNVKFKLKFDLFKSSKDAKHKSSIIDNNASGIIIEDSSTEEIVVSCEGIVYPIHPDSKKTKGKRKVYAKDDQGHWICWDRPCIEDRREISYYLPYRTKFSVRGSIVLLNNEKYFKIKVSWNNNNIDDYNEAMKELENANNKS